jgi:hypothetical protein
MCSYKRSGAGKADKEACRLVPKGVLAATDKLIVEVESSKKAERFSDLSDLAHFGRKE